MARRRCRRAFPYRGRTAVSPPWLRGGFREAENYALTARGKALAARIDSAACSDSLQIAGDRAAQILIAFRTGYRERHMRVLISGAGIAGLTVAYWLRRYGFATTIVERAPSLLTGGYKIDVRGTALQVLSRMGIHDAVVAASTDMQGALLVDGEGKILNKMSGDEFEIGRASCRERVSGTE